MRMAAENGWAVVTVRDEGLGITAEFLPRIFEAFVQSDETLNRSDGGLGVGLTLVRSLVELHQGTMKRSVRDAIAAVRLCSVFL